MKIPCEDRFGGMVTCGEMTAPRRATIFYDADEKVESARVTRIDLHIEAASAEAALSELHALLDGFVPPGHFDGMRTRFSGATAETFTPGKPVLIDGVDVSSGIWYRTRAQPSFAVQISYR